MKLFLLGSAVWAVSASILSADLSAGGPKVTPPTLIKIDSAALQSQLYVSPGGDDTWSGRSPEAHIGTTDGPFATLERARDEIRKIKTAGQLPPGGIAVNLRAGDYHLAKTFELTADDSGTADAPIVYRSYEKERATINGAIPIKADDFKAVTDPAILARLAPAAKDKILQVDLTSLNIQHGGPFPDVFSDNGGLFELFFNGDRMPLSRWPTQSSATMAKVVVNGDQKVPGVFEYRDDEAARWPATGGFWLKGMWRVGWEEKAIKVAAVDTAQKQITFAAGIPAGIGSKYSRPSGNGKEPYHAINLLEEINVPGEWAVDFNSKILYFWPPSDPAKAQVMITQLDQPLVRVTGAGHVAFLHLVFQYSLGDGLAIQQGSDDLVAGCTLRYLAGNALTVDGMHNGIQSCDIYGIGKGCILLTGGDRKSLTPSLSYAINNHLHHYGVLQSQYSGGLDVASTQKETAVGMYLAHNLIHHAPRDAVIFGGNDNVFEYNEIYDCGYDTADTGAFYSWHDWTIRGIVIRYNYLHDTLGGVNPDDAASGNTVFGNILVGNRVGFWVASGPDHVFENNILIKDLGPVFGIDDRGIGRKYAVTPTMAKRLNEVNPDSPPWSTHYPELAGMLNNRPELPWRTVFSRNVVVIKSGDAIINKMSAATTALPGVLTVDDNFTTPDDPGFVDAAKANYALKADSVVFQKIPGFVPIPFDQIGLQVDEYRPTLPTPEEEGRTEGTNLQTDPNRNFGT